MVVLHGEEMCKQWGVRRRQGIKDKSDSGKSVGEAGEELSSSAPFTETLFLGCFFFFTHTQSVLVEMWEDKQWHTATSDPFAVNDHI